MPERINLAAYTEPTPTDGYPGYYSLNREADGSITLTVRSPGHGGNQVGTITLPPAVLRWLANAMNEPMEDPVMIPRGLIGAACAAIRSKADAPNLLEKLRRYTVGDLSGAATASVAGLSEPEYLDGVNITRLTDALVWMGVATETHEIMAALLARYVNELTFAVMRHKDAVQAERATPPAPSAPTVQPLPARLVRFTLRDLKAERKRLDGFIPLGNEIERAAEYDEWIAALEAYCTDHGITAAPTKE